MASTWIANFKKSLPVMEGDYKEAITYSMDHQIVFVGTGVGIPEYGPMIELATCGTRTSVTKYREMVVKDMAITLDKVNDWE